jgi:hypothetical protein
MAFRLYLIACFMPLLLSGQSKYDYVWKFGYQNDTIPDIYRGQYINFNDGNVLIETNTSLSRIIDYYAGISDSLGFFQFYTNGCSILAKDGDLMENGDDLNPGVIRDLYCTDEDFPYYPLIDFATILPYPDHPGLYYLFHGALTKNPWPEDPDLRSDKLYYSVIDMNQNSGLGKVIEKNVVIIDIPDGSLGYSLTAVKHSNNRDWWIMIPDAFSNLYHTVLFTSEGVMGSFTQSIGDTTVFNGSQCVFSPNGSKYARYDPYDGLFLFDFDRESGVLNNYQHIVYPDSAIWACGASFSPNSRYLYTSSAYDVYQFDLDAPDIAASRQHIAHYDGYVDFNPTAFYRMQLGPDCRIYMSATGGSYCCMHVINYPNRPGTACELVQHDIELPYSAASFVYFPNYRLGEEEYPCDSTIVLPVTGVPEVFQISDSVLKIYPNPASQELFIHAAQPGQIYLINIAGQQVKGQTISTGDTTFKWNVSDLKPGLYFVCQYMANGQLSSGKVIIVSGN